MKWLRLIAGPQPILRLIALLMAIIALLLFWLLDMAEQIEGQMPAPLYVCGSSDDPCEVRVTDAC